MFPLSFWIGFFLFVAVALALDLGVFHKKDKAMTFKEASFMSAIWVVLSLLFCLIIYYYAGSQKTLEYITGYVVELSLSMDNVFVFVLIFGYFKVPVQYQHRVLFWGIIGAIVMRFLMITGGIYIFNKFDWIFYIFGFILIYTGVHIFFSQDDHSDVNYDKNKLIVWLRKVIKVTNTLHGNKFFVFENGKWLATPLFVVLLLVEKTDLVFALDSIPAILAITKDPFIVFTSNIFAILGLRSMYFLLATVIHKFQYLKHGIAVVLVFVGCKMIASMRDIHIEIIYSLAFIITTLAVAILASLYMTSKSKGVK